MGLIHNTTFHGVANAFPPTAHGALDVMANDCDTPEDSTLLKRSYGHTHVITHGHGDRELVAKPICGGLQADTSMAPMFSASHDKGMRAWE